MPNVTSPVQIVREIYSAFAERDLPRCLTYLDPDVVIEQDASLPWGGRFEGHQGVVEFFSRLTATVDSRVTTAALYAASDTVVQFGRTAGRVAATGAAFDVPQCHIWRIADGKAVSAEMIIDSGSMLEAPGGLIQCGRG